MCIRDRPDPHQESVQLGFGQGKGALELDRVFGCQDEERPGQGPRLAVDRHLALLHGLEPVSYTHLRAHETVLDLVCRLLLEKKKQQTTHTNKAQQQINRQKQFNYHTCAHRRSCV